MRLQFIGRDPQSRNGNSPALYKTDRTDRATWGVQGWIIDDPAAACDIRGLAPNETVVEVPEEVLDMYVQQREQQRHQGDR